MAYPHQVPSAVIAAISDRLTERNTLALPFPAEKLRDLILRSVAAYGVTLSEESL
jgi:hypothetical protein